MRTLIPSIVAVMMFAACSPHHPASPQAAQPNLSPNYYWPGAEAFSALQTEADVVLEAEGIDRFRLLKPNATVEHAAVGIDGYSHLIPTRAPSGSGLVVLVIPESEILLGTQKIMDEVILDVRDSAKSRGYSRFAVGAHYHGSVGQIYTNGLPSREQVAEKKRSWKEAAEKSQREQTK